MDPSTRRAYEILERREQQEAEHEAWRAAHDPHEIEIAQSNARLAELRARQTKRKEYTGDLIYKTVWNEPAPAPAPQPLSRDDAWNDWARSHCDLVREEMDLLADEAGSMIGKLERRVNLLSAEVKRLRKALKE
jgi:hypothetical protein